jgi:hypothetical protein
MRLRLRRDENGVGSVQVESGDRGVLALTDEARRGMGTALVSEWSSRHLLNEESTTCAAIFERVA